MVLGLYYITKIRPGAKGEGLTFYGPEEALIAHNEGRCDLHALVKVVVNDVVDGKPVRHMVETSVGRVVDRKSTRLNSSHANISYAVFCLKKKNKYSITCL